MCVCMAHTVHAHEGCTCRVQNKMLSIFYFLLPAMFHEEHSLTDWKFFILAMPAGQQAPRLSVFVL